MPEPVPERTSPFPEIDPDDNEVFLDALHEITARWSAGEITAAQATTELRGLEARHGR